jgi:hypothetical protein
MFYYLIASKYPEKSAKSVKILIETLGVEPNKIKMFCHKSQLQDFKDSLKYVEILGHDFTLCLDGKPPFGALRWYGMELLKSYMSDGDAGVLLDDDIVMTRYILPVAPTPTKRFTSKLNGDVYSKKLRNLIETAEAQNIPYFTTNLNYRLHNSYNPEKPLIRTYKWTGFFGFFKWSENPFDRSFSVAADAEAQFKIIFHLNSLNVLQDTGLILATDFKGRKYDTGAEHDRTENYAIIDKRYPDITDKMDYNLSKTNHLIPKRKVLNRLKKNCVWRFRGDEGVTMATCIKCGDEFSDKRKALGYNTCLDCGEQEAQELGKPKKERLLMRLEKENVYRRK